MEEDDDVDEDSVELSDEDDDLSGLTVPPVLLASVVLYKDALLFLRKHRNSATVTWDCAKFEFNNSCINSG